MKAKKYLLSIICVYFCYLTHGIQAIILSQNNVNFAKQWGFNMSDPQSAAYAAGIAAVSTAVAWTGFGKFVSVWIGGEISDRVGRKKLMIGGAILYIICFLGFLFTSSAVVASICGFVAGVATSGFWDGIRISGCTGSLSSSTWFCADRNQILRFIVWYGVSAPGCT